MFKAINRQGTYTTKYDDAKKKFATDDLLPLWVADMDLASPLCVQETLKKRAAHPLYGYTVYPPAYYEAIQNWMQKRFDWHIDKEWIVPCYGVVPSLNFAITAYSKEGDGIIVQTPIYPPFVSSVKHKHRKVLDNTLVYENGKYHIDFEDFELKAKEAKLFLLCSPHNPTARAWDKEELEKLIQICLDNDVLIIADEIHADIVYEKVHHSVGSFEKMAFDDIWNVLKKQAEEGVDFFTIHSGILKKSIRTIKHKRRVGGIVSRGGAILTRWMYVNKKENPLYENFDKILELAKKYHITISLGDALRPGAIADSTDELQLNELYVLGKLIKKCRKAGVQAMVEGPGHIRLDEIGFNVMLEKKICSNAPFYILGPLPTDFATGYDHITSAIGGSIAGLWGADFLCVVTPAEHLRLPTLKDIEEGVIASRIAAHSVDVLRFKREWNKDRKLSIYRAKRNWHKVFPLTVNKIKAEKKRKTSQTSLDMCSMCGKFCSLKISESCNILKNI